MISTKNILVKIKYAIKQNYIFKFNVMHKIQISTILEFKVLSRYRIEINSENKH